MKQGSDAYIEIRIKLDISLLSEMIFSFFAGGTDKLILQKRYSEDVTEVDGRYYIGFTQEETDKLYKESENGAVQMETQVNLANQAVIQQPSRGFTIRRTRMVELVPGNAPQYEMPDTVVDIVSGDVVLLKGSRGKSAYEIAVMKGFEGTEVEWLASLKGKSAYEVAVAMGFEGTEWEWLASLKQLPQPLYFSIGNTEWKYDGSELTAIHINGISHALTDEDQADIAEKTAMLSTVGRYATVPAESWSDDTDLLSTQRVQRVAYRISSTGSSKDIIEHNWNASTDAILTENWQTFEASFVFSPTDSTDRLYLMLYGGKSASFCHPYDIADVKLWRTSDTEHTNLLPEDIAKLNWWWHYDTGTCPEVNRFSVAYDEDGHKYIHVWRQKAFETASGVVNANLAYLRAGTGVKLTAGETYTLSMRMRTTCAQHTAIAECEGIRDHSATVVSPVPTSTAAYLNNGVRAFGQRIGELMLKADTKPNSDITVGIQASRGQGTGVIINNVMPEVIDALDAALLPLIGEV